MPLEKVIDEESLIKDYENGMTRKEIYIKYNICDDSLCRRLKRNNVELRLKYATKEQLGIIADNYENGMTLSEAADSQGFTQPVAERALRIFGKTPRCSGYSSRQYHFNEKYFDEINTEAKAYFLGFLMMDGCIAKVGAVITITQKESDNDVLYKFQAAIESTSLVRTHVNLGLGGPTSVFNACSQYMCASLARLGVLPGKINRDFVPEMPKELERHFWRGVLDADGCISYNNGCTSWCVHLTSNRGIVIAFSEYCRQFGTRAKVRAHSSVFRFTVTGNRLTKKILGSLYQGASIFMDRKYNLYQQVLEGTN